MCPKARRPVRKNVPWLPCVYVVGPRWHLWRSHRFSPYALVPVSSPRSLRRPSLFAKLRGAFGLVNPSERRNTRINESDQRCCKAASVRKRVHKVALASPQVCHTPLPPRIPQARSTDPAAPLTPQRLTGTLAAATPVDKCCLDSNNLVNGIARSLTNEMG